MYGREPIVDSLPSIKASVEVGLIQNYFPYSVNDWRYFTSIVDQSVLNNISFLVKSPTTLSFASTIFGATFSI
jgi:hypothetical protein